LGADNIIQVEAIEAGGGKAHREQTGQLKTGKEKTKSIDETRI